MIALLIAIIGAVAYVVLYYQNVRKYPKGPLPLPLVGNLYHLNPDNLHEYMHTIGKDYGHVFTLFMPRPMVVFTDFTTIKEALTGANGEHFTGRSHYSGESLLQRVTQTGVLMSDGDTWKEQRRIALRIMREHGMGKNIMEAQVNRSIDELLDQLRSTNDGVTPYDINGPLQLCVGNVINETLLGYHFKYTDTLDFLHHLERFLQYARENFWILIVQALPLTRYLPILGRKGYTEPRETIGKFHDFIQSEVKKVATTYDTSLEPTNFVQSYLAEMTTNPQMDLANLCAIVSDFWMAGMETTSTTLRWSLLLLMEHDAVQEKMRSELLAVVGRNRRIEMTDRPRLPYFNAAISELQRHANMVPFLAAHRTTANSVVGGHRIPADTLTLPQIYSVLKDDEVFERPAEFIPDRFLEDDGKTTNKVRFERVIAFGIGKRQCVGEALARMELFLVLGTLLLNYRFEPVESLDLRPQMGTVLVPRPYKCRIVPL